MSRWEQGRGIVEQLLAEGRIERVPPNETAARRLIDRARKHLGSARLVAEDDVELAYDALHAANRKALTAVLLAQGLRPRLVPADTPRSTRRSERNWTHR